MKQIKGGALRKPPDSSADCGHCHMEQRCWPEPLAAPGVLVEREPPLHAGDCLWQQGALARELYLVRHGCIKVFATDCSGDEHVLQFGLPGDLLGLEDLAGSRRLTHAVALGDALLCRVILPEAIDPASSNLQQRLLLRASTLLSKRAHQLRQNDPDLSLHGFLQELAMRLGREMADDSTHRWQLRLPMSRREIGQYLGFAEETICRSLARLQRRGLLQVSGRELRVGTRFSAAPLCKLQ